MTKIKLCGLSRPSDIEIVNALMPEYIGFVFFEKSSRYITPQKANVLRRMLDPEIFSVGVFVNQEPEFIAELFHEGIINFAQLHGNEDEFYIERLRVLANIPIIQAFKIKSENDVLKALKSEAEFILFDAGNGSGEILDWQLLSEIKISRPYFLAGGLNPENVIDAIKLLNPFGVDVSSGIESTPGIKDARKINAFVENVRRTYEA